MFFFAGELVDFIVNIFFIFCERIIVEPHYGEPRQGVVRRKEEGKEIALTKAPFINNAQAHTEKDMGFLEEGQGSGWSITTQ